MGFRFDRAGLRIPTLAISPWIAERTVITDEYRATSLLATMREHWNLGAPFSAREATARSFADIFTLQTPRAPEDWLDIIARPVPTMPDPLLALDAPLGLLGKTLLLSVLSMAQKFGKPVPAIDPDATMTGSEAIAIGHDVLGEIFPAMRD
jgi:phospholipase C